MKLIGRKFSAFVWLLACLPTVPKNDLCFYVRARDRPRKLRSVHIMCVVWHRQPSSAHTHTNSHEPSKPKGSNTHTLFIPFILQPRKAVIQRADRRCPLSLLYAQLGDAFTHVAQMQKHPDSIHFTIHHTHSGSRRRRHRSSCAHFSPTIIHNNKMLTGFLFERENEDGFYHLQCIVVRAE